MPDAKAQNQRRAERLHKLVEALCASEQPDMIRTAESVLKALFDGAMALRFARRYESPHAESVRIFLQSLNLEDLHTSERKSKGGRKQ